MPHSDALTEFRTGPLYFFDQPTRRSRIKGTRNSIWRLRVSQEAAHLKDKSGKENVSKKGEGHELPGRLTGEAHGDGTPDTSPAAGAAPNIKDHGPMDAYQRAAPPLLNELAGLLSQNKRIATKSVPQGITNILNYTWQDLSAGAMPSKAPEPTPKPVNHPESASDQKEAERREAAPETSPNAGVTRRKHGSTAAPNTATGFSILSISCDSPGWIIRPEQLCHDEPPQIGLCQWVVERLRATREPGSQTAEPSQDKPPLLRHYGDAQTQPQDRGGRTKAPAAPLVDGTPQIPDVRQQSPPQQKLHYRISDGSSFIYYPSGRMAVCQSHSGLPCGGFYTNVFSDSQRLAFLATITAFGHGAVTHPLSCTITALWDQDGGFTCDQLGNVIKEWRWTTDHTLRGNIVIQVSDLVSVRLFSGTSGLLCFRCNNETVHLPLSGLSHINQAKETQRLQTDAKFACAAAAHRPLLANTTRSPAVSPERRRNLTSTPASQTVREVEALEEPPARWRRRGHAVRELRRLQRRLRGIADDWLAYYREAIGIKCPDLKRKPEAPVRTRAALPSLNPPERTDAKPEQDGKEPHEARRHLPAPAERAADTSTKLPRTSKKRGTKEPRVTCVGPLQIHGSIQLESVIIPVSLESRPSAAGHRPAPLPFTPSVSISACPVLLRAALLGEGGRRRCCCSSTQMPAVTDLEYDAFVTGRPPHSRQILVVCVTRLSRPVGPQDPLEQLYRRRNKHRTMPCTQCQMDSFRMVRYELSAEEHGAGARNVLLQQRHSAAPGMVLMYIGGKLLFVGHIFNDLQKQISRARAGYRAGVSLPPDQRFSHTLDAHTDARNSRDARNSQDAGRRGVKLLATVEKQKVPQNTQRPPHFLRVDQCE